MQGLKTKDKKDQIFLKNIESQVFCAVFENDQEYSNFLRGKDEQTRRKFWPYRREHIKRCTGLNPDHIKIHPQYAQ